MARRSSARLRGRNSVTPQAPKFVSLSHDAPIRTPRTAPNKLSSLAESEEMPGAFPRSVSPPHDATPSARVADVVMSIAQSKGTPKQRTPIRPTDEEMHPQQHHQTTAKPREEARDLGFFQMAPHTEPVKSSYNAIAAQSTPSKAAQISLKSAETTYQFTFRREQSLDLSPEAKELMQEKRGEAIKIRELMKVDGVSALPEASGIVSGRKLATPKSKVGRFSDIHMAQFKNMDSIVNHASSFRKDPAKLVVATTSLKRRAEGEHQDRSLKESQSKTELNERDRQEQSEVLDRSPSKAVLGHGFSQLPRSGSTKKLATGQDTASPAKRVKRVTEEDEVTSRPTSKDFDKPSTPLKLHPSNPHLVWSLTTPTQASLARAASVKSAKTSKIPAPSLSRSPSKPNLTGRLADSPKQATPLLARSPSKISLFAIPNVEKPKAMMSSTLAQRSLAKPAFNFANSLDEGAEGVEPSSKVPFLARSPLKMPVADRPEGEKHVSSIPLLSQSPSKISLLDTNPFAPDTNTGSKAMSTNLMGRFSLLRTSPMKSILRTPQRLKFSDDPAKIAAGTHVATPPKQKPHLKKTVPAPPATVLVQKHVDFTSSTKAREASKSASSTPSSNSPTPPPKSSPAEKAPSYPTLPTLDPRASPSPAKRRQTAAPADFTFRAGIGITFAPSPKAPASAKDTPPSIRHVSSHTPPKPAAKPAAKHMPGSRNRNSTPEYTIQTALAPHSPSPPHAQASKKRKFDFETSDAATAAVGSHDKENAGDADVEDQRPAKRSKASEPEPSSPDKKSSRLPTLGVRPKKGYEVAKDKRPSMLSRARLDALALPKRRGGK